MAGKDTTITAETAFEYMLVDAARLYKTVYDQRARPRIGLTQSQSRTLIHLARNQGINQAGLAEILEVQPISLARTIDRLAADGWVERRPHPGDRRAVTLHLLPKAEPVLEEMRELAVEMRTDILRSLTEEEQAAFAHALEIVRDNLAAVDIRTERKQEKEAAGKAAPIREVENNE